MKLRMLCVLILCLTLIGSAAMAEAFWATVNNPNPADRLNLRAKPSASAVSYGKYYNGVPVLVLSGPENGWCRVRVGLGNGVCDIEGYMKSEYLAFGSQAAAVRDARPVLTLTDGGRDIPLRSFHSGSCVGKVKSGAQVTVLGVGMQYLHVVTQDGTCGMVPANLAAPRLAFANEKTSAGEHAEDMAVWAMVSNPNPADRLHLRAKPSTTAVSYGKYYNGVPVLVLSGPENGWCRVRVGLGNGVCDIEGYMKSAYLAFDDEAVTVQDAQPTVTLNNGNRDIDLLSFRSGSKVGKVKSGEQATVLGVSAKYLHVITEHADCGLVPIEYATPRLTYSNAKK
ncbi:MAG: hypothetical protein ACI4PG_04625 [Candidatus Ventricola sp.]